MENIELLQKQIRGYLLINNDIPDSLKNKLSRENNNVKIEALISNAKKEIIPADVSKRLVSKATIDGWNKKITTIEDGLKVKNNEDSFDITTQFNKLKSRSFKDDHEALSCIEYLEERAKIQKNRNPSFAGTVKNFASDCKMFYINDKQKIFSFEYRDCINDIEKQIHSYKATGVFVHFQYVQLAEDMFSRYKSHPKYKNDSHLFSVILGIIHEICNQTKVEIPTITTSSLCPKCNNKQIGDICSECNTYIKCPGCKHTIAKDVKTCGGCGIEIDKIESCLLQIKSAEEKFASQNYLAAEQAISDIQIAWTKYEPLNQLRTKIEQNKKQATEYDQKLIALVHARKYFAASGLLLEMKQKYPSSPVLQANENEIVTTIEQVQKQLKEATTLSTENQIGVYAHILSQAADFEIVIERLRQIKIKPPRLSAEIEESNVLLSWTNIFISGASVEYIVTRKEKTFPSITDHRIYTGNGNTCSDNSLLGGKSYFYGLSVILKIQGVEISSATPDISPEMLITSDIATYNITTGDKYIQLNFETNPEAFDYQLHRESEKGEKIQIKDNLKTGNITDLNLINGIRYTYTLISVFKKSNGEILKSAGLKLYATPEAPSRPITSLKFRKDAGNVILSWDMEEKNVCNIRILYSACKVGKTPGTLISVKEAEQLGTLFTSTLPNQLVISLNSNHIKNFFSIWTIGGSNAMFGSEVEVLNVQEVSDLKAYIRSGKIYVEWNWPDNYPQVKISLSNRSFDDVYKTVKNYPKVLYDKQKAYVIDTVVDKDYFIEVQTQKFEDNQEILSSGIRTILRNSNPMTIRYSLKVSSFMGKKLTLKISNDSNNPLPELLLISSPNRMPARKEDGAVIYVIKEGTACGAINLPKEFIRENYYARLFLSDSSIRNITIITPDSKNLKTY